MPPQGQPCNSGLPRKKPLDICCPNCMEKVKDLVAGSAFVSGRIMTIEKVIQQEACPVLDDQLFLTPPYYYYSCSICGPVEVHPFILFERDAIDDGQPKAEEQK